MANRIRDRFNEYADEHREMAFQIDKPKGSYQSVAEVEVLGFDDGKWAYRISASLPQSGMSSPFDIGDVRPSKQEAVRAGVGYILSYMLRCERQANALNEQKVARMAITELRAFLNQKVQASLF